MEDNKVASRINGTNAPMVPADVRALSSVEKEIVLRRLGEYQRAIGAMQAAAKVYQETLTLLTGGDPELGVDISSGMIVRKAGKDG